MPAPYSNKSKGQRAPAPRRFNKSSREAKRNDDGASKGRGNTNVNVSTKRSRGKDDDEAMKDVEEIVDEDKTPFKLLVGSLLSDTHTRSQREARALRRVKEEMGEDEEEEDEEEEEEEDEAEEDEEEILDDEDLDESSDDDGEEEAEDDEDDDDEDDSYPNAGQERGIFDESSSLSDENDESDEESLFPESAMDNSDAVPSSADVFLRRLSLIPDQVKKDEVNLTLPDSCVSELEDSYSRTLTVKGQVAGSSSSTNSWRDVLKPRVFQAWQKYRKCDKDERGVEMSPLQESLARYMMSSVSDVAFTGRTLLNAVELRETYCLHVVNHLMKMRDRVEAHDAKIALRNKETRSTGKPAEFTAEEEESFKDQGFSRPRVLVVLPYKSSAFRFVKLMMELFPEKTRFKNLDRFIAEFGPTVEDDDEEMDEAERDWRYFQQECRYSESYKEADYARGTHPALDVSQDGDDDDAEDEEGNKSQKRRRKTPMKKRKTIRSPDWHACFEENSEEDFRIGISILSKKSVKLYSDFYHSDLIIASPLGLRLATKQAIGAGLTEGQDDGEDDDIVAAAERGAEDEEELLGFEGDKRKKKQKSKRKDESSREEDTDFLSSIEILVIDEADVFHTQNWQHLEDICVAINKRPKVLRKEMDFSRIYEAYLDNKLKVYRQTLVFSGFPDAQLNVLLSRGGPEKQGLLLNMSGAVRIRPKEYFGSASLGPSGLVQRFRRLDSQVDRFEYFKQRIVHRLCLSESGGTLLFVPSYLEFLRVRKLIKQTEERLRKEGKLIKPNDHDDDADGDKKRKKKKKKGVSEIFDQLHEYSAPENITRARTRFFNGHVKLLVMTERFYYYYRYKIRGIHRAIFYSPPQHAAFYSDILDMLNVASGPERESVMFFNSLDALEMERIVGTKQAKKVMKEESDSNGHVRQSSSSTKKTSGGLTRLAGGASEFTIVCQQGEEGEYDE